MSEKCWIICAVLVLSCCLSQITEAQTTYAKASSGRRGYHMLVRLNVGGGATEEWSIHSVGRNKPPHRMVRRDVSYSNDYCLQEDFLLANGTLTQTARVIPYDGTALLPCHLCGDDDDIFTPRIWLRFHRIRNMVTNTLLWQPREVQLDVHSNDLLNRVFTTANHELVIRDFQPGDVGTYFCTEYTNTSARALGLSFTSAPVEQLGAVALALAWHQVDRFRSIGHVHHVDIEIGMPTTLVSENGGLPAPMSALEEEEDNWRAYTEWAAWGECTVCGSAGERRRQGQCTVKLLRPRESARPEYLNHTLHLYPSGAPCHSSLFTGYDVILERPNEIEVAQCPHSCSRAYSEDEYGINFDLVNLLGQATTTPEPDPSETAIIYKREGESLSIACPGAYRLSSIEWKNGSDVLSESLLYTLTADRVQIDVNNSLTFHNLSSYDNGTYRCYDRGLYKLKSFLAVGPPEVESDDIAYYRLILYYSFGVDFIIFMFILCTQHIRRKHQVKKSKEKNPQRRKSQLSANKSKQSFVEKKGTISKHPSVQRSMRMNKHELESVEAPLLSVSESSLYSETYSEYSDSSDEY